MSYSKFWEFYTLADTTEKVLKNTYTCFIHSYTYNISQNLWNIIPNNISQNLWNIIPTLNITYQWKPLKIQLLLHEKKDVNHALVLSFRKKGLIWTNLHIKCDTCTHKYMMPIVNILKEAKKFKICYLFSNLKIYLLKDIKMICKNNCKN